MGGSGKIKRNFREKKIICPQVHKQNVKKFVLKKEYLQYVLIARKKRQLYCSIVSINILALLKSNDLRYPLLTVVLILRMGPLQLAVTWYKIHHAGEQATHWDI